MRMYQKKEEEETKNNINNNSKEKENVISNIQKNEWAFNTYF